jgi:hypothetical protein
MHLLKSFKLVFSYWLFHIVGYENNLFLPFKVHASCLALRCYRPKVNVCNRCLKGKLDHVSIMFCSANR